MCWRCTYPTDNIRPISMTKSNWDLIKHDWNQGLSVCQNNKISHDRPLPITLGTSQLLTWGVLLENTGPELGKCIIELGFGSPREDGLADKSQYHYFAQMNASSQYLSRDSILPWVELSSHRTTSFVGYQATLWSSSRNFRRVIIHNHGSDKSYNVHGEFLGVEGEVFPILALKTRFGTINLIPSTKTPSLEALSSREIARNISKFSDIPSLDMNMICQRTVQREWIRFHKTIVLSR